MSWTAPWKSRERARCQGAACRLPEPRTVMAATLVDGLCVQCVAREKWLAEHPEAGKPVTVAGDVDPTAAPDAPQTSLWEGFDL